MSFSAHKTYGPKGMGALYIRRKPRVRLEADARWRARTRLSLRHLGHPPDCGHGRSFPTGAEEMATENERIRQLRDRLWAGLSQIEETHLNGDLERRVPHNLNVSFNFVEGESPIMALKELAVSSGSACTSASLEPSYVLRALGRSDELARSADSFLDWPVHYRTGY